MTLLNDILSWATVSLTEWQRDAIRRLFQKKELTAQDFDDLIAMLKFAHGIPDPQNRQPVPLAASHLPATTENVELVILKTMRELKHVNRIVTGESMTFAAKGITIIYGGNASGKSGYARVLKCACRSRDHTETVHTDASNSNATGSIPEATFDIEVGGKTVSLIWKRDGISPDELSTIAVFDGRCARAYLDTEQDAAFIPYGLDIVQNLGQYVLPEMTKRLIAEIDCINTDASAFSDLIDDTAVGNLVASLNENTDINKINELGTLSDNENKRLSELCGMLAESDPKSKAKSLRLSAQRINSLISRIDNAFNAIDDKVAEELKACDNEAEVACRTEALAISAFQNEEALLDGTGGQEWKKLFEAARRFSVEVAYREKSFPYVDSDSRCLLCQQSLTQETGKRLQRFEEYLKQDVTKIATEKNELRKKSTKRIADISLLFGIEPALEEELSQFNETLLQTAKEFEKKVENRRKWLLESIRNHVWTSPSPLDDDPRDELNILSKKLINNADDLEKASDETHRKALESEHNELHARAKLSKRLTAIIELRERMKLKSKLTVCKSDLSTRAISNKAKEFASKAVTEKLRDSLNDEFKALGVGNIKTKLVERVEYGMIKHKLILDLPVAINLSEVLSEGEQRAIAVGSFLAELYLSGHKGGIVFDDPVSSLDHHWRKNVARRLAKESKQRQVIILTHDTAFLGELLDEIEQQNTEHFVHHLEWENGRPGHIVDGLPWEHMHYKERLDKLEKEQKRLETIWQVHPNDRERAEMCHTYSFLRATIERVIQDVVFNGVVKRYRDWIRVDKLDDVSGLTASECGEIARLHKTCCDVTDAHDSSSAKNASVPDPTQLSKDITDLKTVIAEITSRRKQQKTIKVP